MKSVKWGDIKMCVQDFLKIKEWDKMSQETHFYQTFLRKINYNWSIKLRMDLFFQSNKETFSTCGTAGRREHSVASWQPRYSPQRGFRETSCQGACGRHHDTPWHSASHASARTDPLIVLNDHNFSRPLFFFKNLKRSQPLFSTLILMTWI